MAEEIYTFRTIRVVDDGTGLETNIIADQSEDVLTFESGGDIRFQVVEDRIIMSTQNVRGYTGSIGFTGSAGYTGSVGLKGDQGYTGSKGFSGDTGYSGSIGYTGSQGIQGNIGYAGSIGFTGSTGADSTIPGYTGSQGVQGIIGFTGSTGASGNVGLTGSQGIQGNIGYTGSQGFIGFTGSTGLTGSQGVLGFSGSIGFSGSRGSGGFAGSRGFTGSQGPQGIQGNQGNKGFTGSRGVQGQRGYTGYSGSRGFTGSVGFTGSKGVPGPQGPAGVGYTGSQGAPGPQGNIGPQAEAFKTLRTKDSNGITRNIIADQSGDVLTWVSGPGIYLDFNEGTDTITVINTGNSTSGNANVSTDGNFSAGNLTLPLTTPASTDIGRVTWDATANVLYIGNGSESIGISGQSETGYTGSQGATGAQGNIGYTGSAGITGAQGNIGYKGSIGFTGSQGNVGYNGSTGTQGNVGYTGSIGLTGNTGATGAQGNVGYTGSVGAQGSIGNIGYTGSAGNIGPQGNAGFIGSIGFTGSAGFGFTGSIGATGPQGNIGFTGSTGNIGATGYTGSLGYTGSQGLQGPQGPQGNTGFNGSQGALGYTGSAGIGTPQTLSFAGNVVTISDSNSQVDLTSIAFTNDRIDDHLNISSASNTQILGWNGSDYAWVNQSSGNNFGIAGNLGIHTFDGSTETLTFLGTTGEMNVTVATNFLSFEFANTGVTSGTYGNASSVPSFTVDEKGRITSVSETAIDPTTLTNAVTFQNDAIFDAGVSEKFSSLTGATGVVTHDCDNGHIFYHTSISADFTANFTNLVLNTNYGTTLTLILDQGATARIPTAVQIGGSAQNINWQGGLVPTGTNNGVDAVSFTILRVSGNYVVLGQLVNFT